LTVSQSPDAVKRLVIVFACIAIAGTILASAGYLMQGRTDHPAQRPADATCGSGACGAASAGPEGDELMTIGIIGGMSWYSTQEYYRIINEDMQEKLGGLHSAKILMVSVDFDTIERLQTEGKWDELTRMMTKDAQILERGGADFIIIGTNTMHKTADDVQAKIHIPLLHIADATGEKIKERGIKKVGLLGTKYTMEQDFYKGRLERNFGLEVVVPTKEERAVIHSVIFDELCKGVVREESREKLKKIIRRLAEHEGVEGVILGCTEIPLLISQSDVNVTLFDTTAIHAHAAAQFAMGGNMTLPLWPQPARA
jgi:aspartate racemase